LLQLVVGFYLPFKEGGGSGFSQPTDAPHLINMFISHRHSAGETEDYILNFCLRSFMA
jgi:hypothetical protein